MFSRILQPPQSTNVAVPRSHISATKGFCLRVGPHLQPRPPAWRLEPAPCSARLTQQARSPHQTSRCIMGVDLRFAVILVLLLYSVPFLPCVSMSADFNSLRAESPQSEITPKIALRPANEHTQSSVATAQAEIAQDCLNNEEDIPTSYRDKIASLHPIIKRLRSRPITSSLEIDHLTEKEMPR
jgi:hypothetical protein